MNLGPGSFCPAPTCCVRIALAFQLRNPSLPAGRRPGSGQVPADQVHCPPVAAGSVYHWQGLLWCRPDGCCAEGPHNRGDGEHRLEPMGSSPAAISRAAQTKSETGSQAVQTDLKGTSNWGADECMPEPAGRPLHACCSGAHVGPYLVACWLLCRHPAPLGAS